MRDLCLAIEISNPSADPGPSGTGPGVALGRAGAASGLLGVELLPPGRSHDDDLVPAIDRLFRRHGAAPKDLARIAVSVGPGGFTSLRMAVAAAKMIAEATGCACVPVASADVVSRRVAGGRGPFAVALASKGETAYVARFTAPGVGDGPGRVMGADDLETLGVRVVVADRFLGPGLRARCAALGVAVVAPVFDPAACFEAGARAPLVDAMELAPIYPRLPEAVVKWRELHPPRA